MLTLVALIAGCGRVGIHPLADASMPDAPPSLACAPARFSVAGTTKRLTATATPRGYDLFMIDEAAKVHGYAYEFVDGQLRPGRENVSVPSDATGSLDAIALDPGAGDTAEVMLIATYGTPMPTGTALIALDPQLVQLGTATHDDWVSGPGSLARGDDGALAFLGVTKAGSALEAKTVSRSGGDLGVSGAIDTQGHTPSLPAIVRGGHGYGVAWGANGTDEIDATILDTRMAVTTPTTKVGFDPEGRFAALRPSVAYSAASNTYLVAWAQKIANGGDEIWVSLRDEQLGVAHAPINLTRVGDSPQVVAGDHDFLVVWEDTGRLGAARVAPSGDVTPVGIPGTGTAAAWDLVVRYGEPALLWIEEMGTGPNLWLDTLCGR